METAKRNDARFSTNLLDDDAALSAFRRRNKILILMLLFLILLLIVAITVSITYFLRNSYILQSSPRPTVNSAVVSFCRVVSDDYSLCVKAFAPKFSPESSVNPNQIFTYSLQTASDKLENFVSFLSKVRNRDRSAVDFVNTCSKSSIEAMKQIGNTLAVMRVNPFVEAQSDDRRMEMANWMNATAENLDSCLGELEQAEPTAEVAEAKETVDEVKDYVANGANFLHKYYVVLHVLDSYGFVSLRRMAIETLFSLNMVGLQLLYMFFLFWCLFRIR